MGICSSSQTPEQLAEAERNRALQERMERKAREDKQIYKLLLLGAGESGKSTLFKQMKINYGTGFDDSELEELKKVLAYNIVQCSQIVIEQTQNNYGGFTVEDSTNAASFIMEEDKYGAILDETLVARIKTVITDPNAVIALQNREKYYLLDSFDYFMDNMDRFVDPDFKATNEDHLHSRVRTTGIVEAKFTVERTKFVVFDLGGQKSERKKWIKCFDEVTAVIFVSALSGFDMVMFEDITTNRMIDSLTLFEEVCNAEAMQDVAMIIFLNKVDLFQEKLALGKTIQLAFPDYDGDNTQEAQVDYIKNEFLNKRRTRRDAVYFHVTQATDAQNFLHVFGDVRSIVVDKAIALMGV